MHSVRCENIKSWFARAKSDLNKKGVQPISGMLLTAGVEVVACCSDNPCGSNLRLLESVSSITNSKKARHGLAIRYNSKIPRVIAMKGRTENGQFGFLNEDSETTSEFSKECASTKVRKASAEEVACAEMIVDISTKMNIISNTDEYLNGEIRLFRIEGDVYPEDIYPVSYRIRLTP